MMSLAATLKDQSEIKPVNVVEYETCATATTTTTTSLSCDGVPLSSQCSAADASLDSSEIAPYIEDGQRVLEEEAEALKKMARALPCGDFGQVVSLIRQTIGRVVITGVGKSGIIGQKIAATLASTGTPSFFVHAGDAAHGDLGMITSEDIILAISKSGESSELNAIVQYALRTAIPLVAITQKPKSTLGRASQYIMLLPDVEEACNIKVAPTTSSTATLAIGDALAVALSRARGFSLKEFGLFHPGGNLGRLSMRVDSVMHKYPPVCHKGKTTVAQALMTMAMKRQGCVGVLDEKQHLIGIISDKEIQEAGCSSMDLPACQIMSPVEATADPRESGHDVLKRLNDHNLSVIFIIHPTTRVPVGVLRKTDLLGAKK